MVTTYGISGNQPECSAPMHQWKSRSVITTKIQRCISESILDEYQLYNDVATQEEVIALYEESGQTFDRKAVAQSRSGQISIPERRRGNLSLPATGESGSVIQLVIRQ